MPSVGWKPMRGGWPRQWGNAEMAHLRCDFRSEAMEMNTSMTVILPEKTDLAQVPVVYLLHGLEDNCTGWARYTSVERYAREKGAALVIPEVQRSFYADMDRGLPYFTFVHEELPEICRGFFGFSARREKNYIMGLSMGGYGALKCALQTPERYAGAAAFSAVADIREFAAGQTPAEKRELQAVFGQALEIPADCDLLALAEKADAARLPRLYLACGEQDSLYPANVRLAQKLKALEADVRFAHWEGIHNWVFWDAAVQKALEHLL